MSLQFCRGKPCPQSEATTLQPAWLLGFAGQVLPRLFLPYLPRPMIVAIAGTTLTPGTAQTIPVANGTVQVSAAGVITFTPAPNYTGPVSFDYTVSDSKGGLATGQVRGTTTPTTPTTPIPDLAVSSPTVSEASPYAVFTVKGAPGQPVKLALASGTATLGTDAGTSLQYFNGSTWVN